MINTKMKPEEEEEKKGLLVSTCKVIEYLEPFMSKDLLFKFPDNSAFDFDYSQSSIWSPLVPRVHSPIDLDLVTPQKLSFGFGNNNSNNNIASGSKKLFSSFKKKKKRKQIAIDVNFLKKMKKKGVVKCSEFSPSCINGGGACMPFSTKAWKKMLKAASKHFKKKKKDPTGRVMFSKSLRDANIGINIGSPVELGL